MEAASTVVIKVKYGDMMRRFNAQIVDEELNLSMDGLREKILSLFSFAPDTELMLTYIDEDSDVVTLVDADDLRDVVKQGLNPVRIIVKLSSEKNARQFNPSSGSSTPLRTPRVQQPLQNLHAAVSEILKSVPEPLCETLLKLCTDLTSKASSSSPCIIEIVDCFLKVGLSYLGQLPESQSRVQPGTNSDVPANSLAQKETKGSDLSKVNAATTLKVPTNGKEEQSSKCNEFLTKLQLDAAKENDKVKLINATGGSMETSSSKELGLKAASLGPDSTNVNVGKREKLKQIGEWCSDENSDLVSSHAPTLLNQNLFLEKKLGESSSPPVNPPYAGNNIPTDKEVNELSEPHPGPKTASTIALDPVKGACLDGRMKSSLPGGFGWSLGSTSVAPGSIWAPDSCTSNMPFSHSYLSPTFSEITVGNASAAQSHLVSQAVPHGSSSSQNDDTGIVSHWGVRCDGCGAHPITGPRFYSKVKEDYDLCSICFKEMGNGTDYVRMDSPAVHQSFMSFKGLSESNQPPMLPHVCSRVSKIKSYTFMLDSRFVQDVNVTDGTFMAPLTPFTKIWRMRNNGMVVWPQKTQLVWIGGDLLSNKFSVELEIPAAGLPVDQELDIAVDFISPERPGRYISYWRMISPYGQKFGQRLWVLIQVDGSLKETPRESIRSLNLNFPPASSGLIGPEIVNVDAEPVVADSKPEAGNSRKTGELVEPVPNNFQGMKFPINNSLLVNTGASSFVPCAGPSVPYPIAHVLDPPPPSAPFASAQDSALEHPGKMANTDASSSGPFAGISFPGHIIGMLDPPPASISISSSQESVIELPGKKELEEKRLRELEEMGFKQVDLNKEILRINEYDLKQSVDELCGVAEWDPLLEELQEMGFGKIQK